MNILNALVGIWLISVIDTYLEFTVTQEDIDAYQRGDNIWTPTNNPDQELFSILVTPSLSI